MTQEWTCPQCGMTFDLDKSENREFAILDLLAHVLGIHEGIHEEVADATQEG